MISGAPRSQNGASMVEMALVITIFLMLVFAVFEFALAVFYASRLSESTRAGARFAIVSKSTVDNVKEKSCSQLDTSGFQQCTTDACGALIESMNKVVTVPPSNVYIRYQCSTTGYTGKAGYTDANNEIYSITVAVASGKDANGKLIGVQYPLIIPNEILHLPNSYITMPVFETTRLSEDLWSPED